MTATIRTPDQRLRVFVSSTLGEMAELTPVMFELGARPHPPRELYRAYLAQSDIFIGLHASASAQRTAESCLKPRSAR